ncbi:MAG: DUF2442 domain-containing protein [Fretibacterium sp.]|nr:DUF2442 domain-containing protein [Fretibacterium sp.]
MLDREARLVPFIKSVAPLSDWRLFVEMASGSWVVVDMRSKLETARYADLRDAELFRSVTTDGDFVSWGDGRVTVTARELMDAVFFDRKALE